MSRASSWKRRRGRAPAARAGGYQRDEYPKAHGLQELLRHLHLERAVASRLWGQRDANRVADALLQQHAQRRRGRDDAFGAHARLGEAEMQGIIRPSPKVEVDRDQILHRRYLG